MRQAFREAGFGRLYVALSTSMLGDSIMLLVLSMWVKTLTGSNAMAGLTFFFMVLPAVGAPVLGAWIDQWHAKAVLVRGNLLSALVVLPLVLVRDAGDVWLVWLVAFGYGISFIVLPAALNGLLKDLLPEDRLVDANAALQTTKQGFRLLGPLAGAALFAAAGGWAVALVDAASFVVAAIVVRSVPVRETTPEHDDAAFWPRMTAGVRFLARDRVLRHVLIGFGAMIAVIGFFEASIYALLDGFDRPATYAGVLVAVQGVGAVLGAPLIPWLARATSEVATLVIGLMCLALPTLAMAIAGTMPLVLCALVIMGFGIPCTFVPFTTLLQRRTPRPLMGRVSAATEILVALPQAASLALGSLLVVLLSWRTIFELIAAAVAAGAAYIVVTLRTELRDRHKGRPVVSL